MEVKSNSLSHQNPKLAKEKAFFPRASRGLEPREKDKPSKCCQQKAVAGESDGRCRRSLFPPKSSRCDQNPCPTKVSVEAEELVRHMSNVPGYLQRVEKGDNLQGKALNFGVLDWRRLEKWTGHQSHHRQPTANEKASFSPASSNTSSMFGSSSQSCGSSGSSYLAQRKQSPSLSHYQDSSTEEDYAQISEEEASCNSIKCHSPEFTCKRCPVRHRISGLAEQCPSVDNSLKFEESKQKGSGSRAFSDVEGRSPGTSFLSSRSKDSAISNSMNRNMKPLVIGSDNREKKSGELGYECLSSEGGSDEHCPQDHRPGLSQLNDCISGRLQKSTQSSRRFSFESTESGCVLQSESGCRSFLGALPSEDFQYTNFSPNVAHSCPFPYDIQSEWLDGNICEASEVPCDPSNSPSHSTAAATVRLNACQEKHHKSVDRPHNNSVEETPERRDWNRLKAITPTQKESLLNNHSSAGPSGMIRSSSLGESSAARQPNLTLDTGNGDKAADRSRGRRSPLRRLLDPLLKPRALNRTHPRLAAGSTRQPSCKCKLPIQEGLTPTDGLHCSYGASKDSSGDGSCKKGSTSASWAPLENHSPAHNEKRDISSAKQALLRLAWKNGLPLLTFSVNESDILAATRRKGTSVKEGCDCIYTFHYVCESKKKTGSWLSQGNKGKRKELVSRVVGQMNVSSLRWPRDHTAMRKFVLFGPKLRPTAHDAIEPVPNSELAAVIVRSPEENVESFTSDMLQVNSCQDRPKTKLVKDQYACLPVERTGGGQNLQKNDPTITAILPAEAHGTADGGKPSPLVERWISGGLCDCGGWDVGCSLSILTTKLQDSESGVVQPHRPTDGTHRVELFMQGGDQETGPPFSLVAFKEGLYTVHFHASMAVLQAFAVCVAILHGRRHTGLNELQDAWECTEVGASAVTDHPRKQVEPSSMSVLDHPPLSPVGRA